MRAPRAGAADEVRTLRQKLAVCRDEMDLLAQTAAKSTQELELSRRRYADLYDLAPIGYATLDRRGVILEINQVGATLLGHGRRSLVGRPLRPLVAQPDRRRWQQHLVKCRTERDTATTQLALELSGGRQRAVEVCSQCAVGLDGQPRLLTTLVDITERKQAEEALRASEANFRSYFENLVVGTAQIDTAGYFTRVNDRFCEITGYHRTELLGRMGPLDLDHPEDREADRRRIARFFRGETPHFEAEKRYVRKNGDVVWVRISAGAVRDAAGRLCYTAGIIEDITERKRTDEALRATEERLALATSGTGIGMFERHIATGETLCTEQHARLLGFPVTAFSGATLTKRYDYREWADRVHPEDLPRVEAELRRCMAEHAKYEAEYRVVWPDKSVRWLVARGIFQYDATQKPLRMLGIAMDITERKTVEAVRVRRQAWETAKAVIGRAGLSGAAFDAILKACIDAVAAAADAPVGLIRIVDPETRDLVLVAGRNLLPEYRQVAGRVRWGEHVAGEVADLETVRVVDDVSVDSGLALLSRLTDPPTASLICAPLKLQGQVFGTMTLGHPQPHRFCAADSGELLLCADVISGVIQAEQLRNQLREESQARALLLRELDHRVRNTLATLIGLLNLTAENVDASTEAVLRATAERVSRLADVHAALAERGQRRADLRQIVETVAKSVMDFHATGGRICCNIDVPPVELRSSQATTVALVFHELFTNCVKHAFRGADVGTVSVEGRRDGQDLHLTVCDDGHGPPAGKFSAGTGLTIVETLVTHTLRGAIWMAEARGGGHLAHFRFPRRDEAEPEGLS